VTSGVFYASREQVKASLDYAEPARQNDQVERALASAVESINSLCHRIFYPFQTTIIWQEANTRWRLWLGNPQLWDLESVLINDEDVSEHVVLQPNVGPPFELIELQLSSPVLFPTRSRQGVEIKVSGTWGYEDEVHETSLSGVVDDTQTIINVNNAGLETGMVIRVGDERMIVTSDRFLATGETLDLAEALPALDNETKLVVTDSTSFVAGETILIGAESMKIVVVGDPDTLIVRRAWDGSVLAEHASDAAIMSRRTLTVERGALGTEADEHEDDEVVLVHRPPTLVNQLAVAETIDKILQENAGYARTSGTGDNQRETRASALKMLREDTYRKHGRKVRTVAV
jgi:hypothetical protein